jgi:hypothetical protein
MVSSPMSQFNAANALAVCSITTIVKQPESEDSVFCNIRLASYSGSAFPVSCITFSIPITTEVVSIL